nr:hypothetical protein [Tanacetum cinerariifolium]
TSSNTSRAHKDNTPRINRGIRYDNQKVVNVARARENVGTQVVQQYGIQCYNCKEYGHVAKEYDWRDDTDDEPEDQELEAHYLYMAKIQEITLDATDNSRSIFNIELLHKMQNDNDNYNVFSNDREHPGQPESVNDTYLDKQGDTNITIDSLDMRKPDLEGLPRPHQLILDKLELVYQLLRACYKPCLCKGNSVSVDLILQVFDIK